MTFARNGVLCLAGGVVAALALSACTGGKGGGGRQSAAGNPNQGQRKGGTLYLDDFNAFPHLDPQRIYNGDAISFASRTLFRTLETFPAAEGADSTSIVPDAATDVGQRSADAKTWTFTLKPNVKWQDGKAVTCADFKYGISRTFATDDGIVNGPSYAMDYLNIPRNADGGPAYNGPYKKQGQAAYDKAVVCLSPTKIVFHLRHPVADFNETVTLPAFGAVRQDKDTGAKIDFVPFSDGPYMVQGKWDPNRGGTVVRNPYWVPSTDAVRKAYPDTIVVKFGDTAAVIASKLIADQGNDKNLVTMTAIPPSNAAQVLGNPSLMKRVETNDNGYIDYLTVNVAKIPQQQIRQAIAMAVDKTAYVTAWGGSTAGVPTNSIISPLLAAYTEYDAFGTGKKGDPAKAKAILQAAGVKLPYAITYDYRKSDTQDKVAATVKANLESAGFKVTVNGLGDNYYDVLANPAQAPQLSWSAWAADWPSASTIIPPLFDGRANITASSYGNDLSAYNDPVTNKAIDVALSLTDSAEQQKQWSDLDQKIVKQAVAIPMMANKWFFIHGSNVTGFIMNGAYGGYVDLAVAAVK
jgi:peptide/nickel transport system substrate-binding protein